MKRSIKILGLSFLAVLALGGILAANAMAEQPRTQALWELEGNPITQTYNVESQGELKLKDAKGGLLGGPVQLDCTGTDKGTISPEGKDELTEATATSCAVQEGSCPNPRTATAVNLPWVTHLWDEEVSEGVYQIRDEIVAKNGKPFGWRVVCGGIVEDECTTASTSTLMENINTETEQGVKAVFDAASGTANCTRGGKGAGSVRGYDFIHEPEGFTHLTVQQPEKP